MHKSVNDFGLSWLWWCRLHVRICDYLLMVNLKIVVKVFMVEGKVDAGPGPICKFLTLLFLLMHDSLRNGNAISIIN